MIYETVQLLFKACLGPSNVSYTVRFQNLCGAERIGAHLRRVMSWQLGDVAACCAFSRRIALGWREVVRDGRANVLL